MLKIYTLFFLFCALTKSSFSQASEDSSYEQAVNIYETSLGVNTHLYNGYSYVDFDHTVKGSPFFLDSFFSNGSITYSGLNYTDIKMFYDIFNNNIVISSYNSSEKIILLNENISSFELLGHRFIKTTVNDIPDFKNNFFEVLYNGNSLVLVKRKKVLDEKLRTTFESEKNFIESDTYFIKNKNNYYKLSRQTNLLNVFHDHKKEIQKYIRKEKLKFNSGKDKTIKQVAEYYDSLNAAK